MNIDADTKAILKDAGLGPDALWLHKQSGKYIMYHWACERAAAHKGITFDQPYVVTADPANKVAVMCVTGNLGDKSEWSFGEAAPYNTQQNYPFAMAEKRAKDRVILKLIGLHGIAYSEIEADFKEKGANDPDPEVKLKDWASFGLTKTGAREEWREVMREIDKARSDMDIDALLEDHANLVEAIKQCSETWPDCEANVNSRREDIREREAIRGAA